MRPCFPFAVLLLCGLSANGCGSGSAIALGGSPGPVNPTNGSGTAFAGTVQAGGTPLAGAQVELFAAGIAGNGSAPTRLLAAALLTDTSGRFQVAAGSYDCPADSAALYLVSTGGHLGSQTDNPASVFTAVLGSCAALAATSAVVLNELTTVAAGLTLRPFLSAAGQLGSPSTNQRGLALGVATVATLVDRATGIAPGAGFPANGAAPVAKLNSLANVLHSCAATSGVNSPGCANLFAQTSADVSAPDNTLQALLAIANAPARNVDSLYALGSGNAAFSPALAAAPPDWIPAVSLTGGGMHGPTAVSVDSAGQVWVANYMGAASLFANTGASVLTSGISGYGLNESYGGAVDATDRIWVTNQESDYAANAGLGSITVLNETGPALPGDSQLVAGGLDYPTSIAFDRNGNAWVVDYGNSRVTELNGAGLPLSGLEGYASTQFAFPVAIALDSLGNGWVANQSARTVTRVAPNGADFQSYTVGDGPAAVAVDALNNVWTANYYGNSLGLVSATGQVLSGAGFTGAGLNRPTGIAADGAGTAWVANYRAPGVSSLAGSSAAIPGAALSPGGGWGPDLGLVEAFGVAIDAAGNVWVTSYGDNRLVKFLGAAAPVKTPLLGGVRLP